MAKKALEKYTFFYERWAANHSSREKALDELNKMQTEHIAKFGQTQVLPETYFDFIIDAWRQIIECRRLLKWTYAYGYYLPDQELVKKQFFEDIQGEAEQRLEQLHLCAEKEVFTLYKEKAPHDEIVNFRTKLVGLTSVTGTYFENLVKVLENGLSDVNTCESSSSNALSSENLPKTSKGKSKKEKKKKKVGIWACNNCACENSIDVYLCKICEYLRDNN
ncbi:zinc finger, RanBP2-type [Artemisia annua]|uniref:Zinc finger, RanBP2-type n=1 Tax=Artemisia annua TaxID=35608 RepID=A0A2U1NWJ6_ARTAN|nr:zinc finger, RanBP2-type [Artemisia annua]